MLKNRTESANVSVRQFFSIHLVCLFKTYTYYKKLVQNTTKTIAKKLNKYINKNQGRLYFRHVILNIDLPQSGIQC